MTMTNEEIISIALSALHGDQKGVDVSTANVRHQKRHMSLDRNRTGWVVSIRLDVPDGFEPNVLQIEVCEDDMSTHMPRMLENLVRS
jgi:hypothetical protein